ncbi:MAG: LPXTG cell wall anchor domain-containing protein [Oscillospiraceae bacterium]|nr:LPXTG cell wall anchor domain-containing protein [Oscillospiraceae bacterium]
MKNAMKKLTSLLLVALLLVGVMPFAAFANDDVIPGGSNGGSGSDTTNLLTLDDDDAIIPNNGARTTPAPAAATTEDFEVVIKYDDGTADTKTGTVYTAEIGTNARTFANQYLAGTMAELAKKYDTSFSPTNITAGMEQLIINCTTKTVPTYGIKIEINGTDSWNTKTYAHGDELTLDANLLAAYTLPLPEGESIASFKIGNSNYRVGDKYIVNGGATIVVYTTSGAGSNNGAGAGTGTNTNTQIWADVVINPAKSDVNSTLVEGDYVRYYTTSDGYITPEQRDDLAQKIVGKNIIAWKLKDGRTSASIRDFKFTEPTNVYPVIGSTTNNNGSNTGTNSNNVEYTVTFVDHTGTKVLHTANTNKNGKLSRDDVELAGYRANNVEGYTFSNRWQVGTNANSTVSTDALVEMTFTANTTVSPRYTQDPVESDIVTSTKNQNDIFLNIFVNKDFNNCKTVKLNDHWVISDNKITTYEILNYVVTDYYKASNTNLGLQCDGLYYSVGSFMYNWLLDNAAVKTDAIDNIDVKRANGTVTINVMVTNAVAKGTTTVASDNPKTGDTIYTAMTVMGLSAASLAAVMYVFNKKRHTV